MERKLKRSHWTIRNMTSYLIDPAVRVITDGFAQRAWKGGCR